MTEHFGTCPTCGGWAKSAVRDALTGETAYRCAKGHTWTLEASALVVAHPLQNVHDFELEKAATVYLTGALVPVETWAESVFVSVSRLLRDFGLEVISVPECKPVTELARDRTLGMAWCAPPEFRSYLLRDLLTVSKVDVVAVLPEWERSLDVTAVISFARACGIPVMTIDELLHLLQGDKG